MKIQTSFVTRKKYRSVFNENIDYFCDQEKYRSVFNENTDQFLFFFKKGFDDH